MLNRIKHLENDENNGIRMRKILALNRHWYDVLLDYSPTYLTIEDQYMRDQNITCDAFIQSIQASKRLSLHNLTHFKINGLYDTESFDVVTRVFLGLYHTACMASGRLKLLRVLNCSSKPIRFLRLEF